MATKKPSKRDVRRIADSEAPLGPDDYVVLNNKPATKQMPKELAAEAKSLRVQIYSPAKSFDPRKTIRSGQAPGVWEMDLPQGTGLGLPGLKGGRMSPAEVVSGIKGKVSATDNSEPFQPEWVDYTPHAKISTASKPLLRRIDGRPVEPFFGIFGADDRQVYYPSGYPCLRNK